VTLVPVCESLPSHTCNIFYVYVNVHEMHMHIHTYAYGQSILVIDPWARSIGFWGGESECNACSDGASSEPDTAGEGSRSSGSGAGAAGTVAGVGAGAGAGADAGAGRSKGIPISVQRRQAEGQYVHSSPLKWFGCCFEPSTSQIFCSPNHARDILVIAVQ
jgi:hypothetical protein